MYNSDADDDDDHAATDCSRVQLLFIFIYLLYCFVSVRERRTTRTSPPVTCKPRPKSCDGGFSSRAPAGHRIAAPGREGPRTRQTPRPPPRSKPMLCSLTWLEHDGFTWKKTSEPTGRTAASTRKGLMSELSA